MALNETLLRAHFVIKITGRSTEISEISSGTNRSLREIAAGSLRISCATMEIAKHFLSDN